MIFILFVLISGIALLSLYCMIKVASEIENEDE